MVSERIRNAVLAATGWLRENRDKHITGDLAVTTDGRGCEPNDPNAECFCVLGRISKELNVPGYPAGDEGDDEFKQFLRSTGVAQSIIYGMNDDGFIDPETGKRVMACREDEFQGNPKVLDFLDNKVNENGQ